MSTVKDRAYWRLRMDTNFHWLVILLFAVIYGLLPKTRALLEAHYFKEIMIFGVSTVLFKEFLIKQSEGRLSQRFWIFSMIDVVIISLIYSFGYPFVTFAIMLYLIVLLSTMFETVPGELAGTTVLCLSGYLMNTIMLWPQNLAYCRSAGFDAPVLWVVNILGLLTMLLFIWIAQWISGFDKEINHQLNEAIQEKDESLDKLAKINAVLEEKYVESYTLNLVQENIFQELDKVKVLENAADILMGVLGGKFCLIYLAFPKDNILKCMVKTGVTKLVWFPEQCGLDEAGSLPQILRLGAMADESSLRAVEREELARHGVQSTIFVPLSGRERTWGLIVLTHEWKDAFSSERRTLVKLIAHQLGLALDNSELHLRMKELATHDPLTGLFNRHFLNSYVNDLDGKGQIPKDLACVILDVDHFKRINDTYGHLTGDDVLRKLAAIIREVSAERFSARYGGEEFVILSEAGLDETYAMAERIRERVRNTPFQSVAGETVQVTISCGVAGITENAADIPAMLNEADKALYQAKNNGRNRTVISEKP